MMTKNSLLVCAALVAGIASAQDTPPDTPDALVDTRPTMAPDIREDDLEIDVRLRRGNAVVVPVPISNPTLGSGLVLGGAYFYAQTEEQARVQPASVTAVAGLYTNNYSKAVGAVHQSYWNQNKWRLTAAAGLADFRFPLYHPEGVTGDPRIEWQVDGSFFFARLSGKIASNWYGGGAVRVVDADQAFNVAVESADFDIGSNLRSAGLGVLFEYDSRDLPLNTYDGRYFTLDALFNDELLGSSRTYQSYRMAFRSFHEVTESTVLAWQAQACYRGGQVPLWDGCFIPLRGFSATDHIGRSSVAGQAELRWRMNKRWGFVTFAGAGKISQGFVERREPKTIPSYGVGLRFTVLQAKRINLRLDFARSRDSDAVHFSVGEAF